MYLAMTLDASADGFEPLRVKRVVNETDDAVSLVLGMPDFAGGSGITPIHSLIGSALAGTSRRIRLFYANRSHKSVIFAKSLAALADGNPDRLTVRHHIDEEAASRTDAVTIELDRRTTTVQYRPGNTLLQTARTAGLRAPSSCETGSCGTCMARIVEGGARMLNNDALDDDEVAEGWVLTCQSLPTSRTVRVVYE
jgi:ferredoxin